MLCDLLKTHVFVVSDLRSTIDHTPLKYRSSIETINQIRHVYLPMTVTLISDEKEQQDIHGDWNVINNNFKVKMDFSEIQTTHGKILTYIKIYVHHCSYG